MSSICISHKKMIELKEKLSESFDDTNLQNQIYNIMKEFLKYEEDTKTTHDKETYIKYRKKYYEKNKDKLIKANTERRKQRKIEQLELNNLEKNYNSLSIK